MTSAVSNAPLSRHLVLYSVCFLSLIYFAASRADGGARRYRRPFAEIDPDAIVLRSRANSRDLDPVPTTSAAPASDQSSFIDELQFDPYLFYWNFSSVADDVETGEEGETTIDLPEEDADAAINELVLRLEEERYEEEEAELDEMERENTLVNDALAARRARPSSRIASSKNKKKKNSKKRNDVRDMYSPLSNKHKQRLLSMHNSFRRRVPGPAADMEEMFWDDELTLMAKKYAKKCIWAHGQAMESTKFKHVGQNLAYGTSHRNLIMTPFYLSTLWYNEKDDYDIDADSCQPNKLCGHYTQMVWSDTNRLGCATHWCDELSIPGSRMVIRDALYLVCNYGPGGNIRGKTPYEIGRPCTQCASGSGKCRDGLCSDCSLRESSCDCMLKCQNGGVLDRENCECSCPVGWMGPSCDAVCNNTHTWCGNGWPRDWCFNKNDDNPVEELCPALCGVCECGGPPCLNGGRKGMTSCSCDCPSPWTGEDCSVCGIKCEHGLLDRSSCECRCNDGWMGLTCSEPCANKHPFCFRGWYPNWCDEEHHYVLSNCPAMCELCKMNTDRNTRARAGSCRKTCENGGSLRLPACECDCPPNWFGDDCALECRDKLQCGRWSNGNICSNHDFARYYCPVACELCSQTTDIGE